MTILKNLKSGNCVLTTGSIIKRKKALLYKIEGIHNVKEVIICFELRYVMMNL